MEVDDQPMSRALESMDVLGNHRQQALTAVFAYDRHHVLGSVPEGVSDPSDALAVWLEDLAIDDILHKELGAFKRRKCCAWQVDLLSNKDGSGFSRCDSLEANEKSDLHATACHEVDIADFLGPRQTNPRKWNKANTLRAIRVEKMEQDLARRPVRPS
jgi:hypothetical protein